MEAGFSCCSAITSTDPGKLRAAYICSFNTLLHLCGRWTRAHFSQVFLMHICFCFSMCNTAQAITLDPPRSLAKWFTPMWKVWVFNVDTGVTDEGQAGNPGSQRRSWALTAVIHTEIKTETQTNINTFEVPYLHLFLISVHIYVIYTAC